jgi:hypothetical protein
MENFEKRDRSSKQEDPQEKQNRNLPGQEESERLPGPEESERGKSGQTGRPSREDPGEGVTSHYGSEPSREGGERSPDKPSGEEAGDGEDEGVE